MEEIIKKIDNIIENKYDYKYIKEEIVLIYYLLGKYLYNNKKSYNLIYEVEDILRKKYGLLIGFTRRNLNNMVKFYSLYQNENINKLKNISWDLHLIIMKQNNKKELIKYCLKYNIDKKSLNKIIKNGFNEKYISNNNIEDDIVTLEIIKKLVANPTKI
ncbi:MAG: DUF1016 domain-containing protein [Lactobacillales bacterium]|nr:DUF1016 domain-containing protein [Lactobacillales bacterium]